MLRLIQIEQQYSAQQMKQELENNQCSIESIRIKTEKFAYENLKNFKHIFIAFFKLLRLITIKENVSSKFVKRTIELLSQINFILAHKQFDGVIQFGYVTKYLDKLSDKYQQCEQLSLFLKTIYRQIGDNQYSSQDSQTMILSPQQNIERFYKHVMSFIPITYSKINQQIKSQIDIIMSKIFLDSSLLTSQKAYLYYKLLIKIIEKYDSPILYYAIGQILQQISTLSLQQHLYDLTKLQAKIIYVLQKQVLKLLQKGYINNNDNNILSSNYTSMSLTQQSYQQLQQDQQTIQLTQKQYSAIYLLQLLVFTPDTLQKQIYQEAQEQSINDFGVEQFCDILIKYKKYISLFQIDLIVSKYQTIFDTKIEFLKLLELLICFPSKRLCQVLIKMLDLQYQRKYNLFGIELNYKILSGQYIDFSQQNNNKDIIEQVITSIPNDILQQLRPDQKYVGIVQILLDYDKEKKLQQVMSSFQMYCLQLLIQPPTFSYHQISLCLEKEQLSFIDYYQLCFYYYIFGLEKGILSVGFQNEEFDQVVEYFRDFFE